MSVSQTQLVQYLLIVKIVLRLGYDSVLVETRVYSPVSMIRIETNTRPHTKCVWMMLFKPFDIVIRWLRRHR